MAGSHAEAERPAQGAKKPAPKFTVAKLAEYHRSVFGVSESTFAGATAGLQGEFTVEEMQAHIKKWLGSAINPGKKEEK